MHPIDPAVLAEAQSFDPYNVDDAFYAVCHPHDYDQSTLKVCEKTLALSEEYS